MYTLLDGKQRLFKTLQSAFPQLPSSPHNPPPFHPEPYIYSSIDEFHCASQSRFSILINLSVLAYLRAMFWALHLSVNTPTQWYISAFLSPPSTQMTFTYHRLTTDGPNYRLSIRHASSSESQYAELMVSSLFSHILNLMVECPKFFFISSTHIVLICVYSSVQ